MSQVLVFIPRDGLFLKDGREWASSASGHAHSLHWPFPSTLLGALRTAFGQAIEVQNRVLERKDWEKLAGDITLVRTVALRRALGGDMDFSVVHRCWPVPADALFLKGDSRKAAGSEVLRLDPRPSDSHVVTTMGREGDGADARDALWRPIMNDLRKPGKAPVWWPENAFIDWLRRPLSTRPWAGELAGLELPRRVQAHVGIDPATRTHRPQILFAHDIVETLECRREKSAAGEKTELKSYEWALGCEVEVANNRKSPIGRATLGGGRAPAAIVSGKEALFGPPAPLMEAFKTTEPNGLRLVAVTPLAFEQGWLPDGFSADVGKDGEPQFVGTLPPLGRTPLILRAALVPRPTHVSGWDLAKREPKPTKRLVPAGATYFFVKANALPFDHKDARNLWLAAIGSRQENAKPLGDWIDQGFGRVVPGIWNPEEQRT